MIRINLLGQSKQKKQHAAAATMEVGDVGTPRVKVLVILVVALLINAGWWYQLDKQKQDIATQMQAAAWTSLVVAFTAMKRAFAEIRETGTFTGLSAQECIDARQQIEDLVGLEKFYVIEEETVEQQRWGKR